MPIRSLIFPAKLCLALRGSTTAAPRSAYPGAPPPAPATLKGAQRPAMTSPASGIPGAPYRGTAWTQGYAPTQPTYRYTAPQTYAYTPHTTTQLEHSC
uniref:Uncharacterized protein n=1 Tax=Anopheles arabiensis TaxID=7173 RepID=A0A182I1V2_ANOAR